MNSEFLHLPPFRFPHSYPASEECPTYSLRIIGTALLTTHSFSVFDDQSRSASPPARI